MLILLLNTYRLDRTRETEEETEKIHIYLKAFKIQQQCSPYCKFKETERAIVLINTMFFTPSSAAHWPN